ncbi:DnaB-like helicase C-terminal domain-containing protein [Azohydromonas lata]|uniref:DnaB-like helicase C-terminal domain-containing protein n=1 Tax=Azohydromonas lata TaxID=45677 RepID=UPI0008322D30|nr:DnaB-like helicase C-terminal domain-containing protein [Azohydromonas lata]
MTQDTARTQRLLDQLRRLFLLPEAPAPELAALQRQLMGGEAASPALTDAQGRVRLLAVGLHGVSRGQGDAHCAALLHLGKALIEDLSLPEAAFSVDGREGYDLWLPLAEPVPVDAAREFLSLLQEAYLPELPAVRLRPGAAGDAATPAGGVALPPGLHAATALWSVFIAPGLAPSFSAEAGIDLPPNLDKQAELLARLEPIPPALFQEALGRLRQRVRGAVPAQEAGAAAACAQAEAPPAPAVGERAAPGPLAGVRDELMRALTDTAAAVVATPFPGLTSLLHGGFRAGRLYLLLAPPKAGKTTLAAHCLDHAAANGHPALYAGYEMAREQLVHGALARRLKLDARRIEGGLLAPEDVVRVAAALDAYLAREGQALTLWEADAAVGLAGLAAWARAARESFAGRAPLLVVDPLPLLRSGIAALDAHADAAHRLGALAAACKDLARGTGAAVLALCPAGGPLAGDVQELPDGREVQALYGAADGVLVLQASGPRAADEATPQRLQLSLALHRGRTGRVLLDHWRAFHAMEEAAVGEGQPGLARD